MIRVLSRTTLCLVCIVVFLPGAMDSSAQPGARLGISPERYIVQLSEGGSVTESLMVKNLSDEPMSISISVGNWELDENNRVRSIPPQENSLDRWIVINPLRVTIPPNTPQTIRWAIMPRTRPQQGEYRAMIYIQEDVPDEETRSHAAVRLNMRMGIPVYAQVGEALGTTSVKALEVGADGRRVTLTLSNGSNRHARLQGHYGVWRSEVFPGREKALRAIAAIARGNPEDGTILESIPGIVVLPGNERSVAVEPVLPSSGDYVMQLDASFGGAPISETLELRYAGQ